MTAGHYFSEECHNLIKLLVQTPQTPRRLVRRSGFMRGVKRASLFLFISSFIAMGSHIMGELLKSLLALAFNGTAIAVVEASIGAILIVIVYILAVFPFIIAALIAMLIWYGPMWAIAKLFGGSADFGAHFSALTYPLAAVAVLGSVVWGALNIVTSLLAPIHAGAAGIFGLVSLVPLALLGLYGLKLQIDMTAEAHQFGLVPALCSVVLPTAILAFGAFLLAAIFSAILMALLGYSQLGAFAL